MCLVLSACLVLLCLAYTNDIWLKYFYSRLLGQIRGVSLQPLLDRLDVPRVFFDTLTVLWRAVGGKTAARFQKARSCNGRETRRSLRDGCLTLDCGCFNA